MATQTKFQPKRLYRSKTDRLIGGVCGGLAQYLEVDATIIRIIFLVLVFSPVGIPLYLLMWIVVPSHDQLAGTSADTVRSNAQEIKDTSHQMVEKLRQKRTSGYDPLGIILVLAGLYFLLTNWGLLDWLQLSQLWPLLLIALGVFALKK